MQVRRTNRDDSVSYKQHFKARGENSLFNICVVDSDGDSRKEICERIDEYFADFDVEYRTELIDCRSLTVTEICRECGYDLAILDISDAAYRKGLLEYSQLLRKWHRETKVIFISDKIYCVLDTFDYDPDYFIFKPQTESRIINAMNHLFNFKTNKESSSLTIGKKSARHIIMKNSILYMEHYQHNTRIVCEDKEIVCHEKISTLLEKLDSRQFVRCHCSFGVNLRHVSTFSRTQIVLSNGDVIPCSRSKQKTVRAALRDIHEVII